MKVDQHERVLGLLSRVVAGPPNDDDIADWCAAMSAAVFVLSHYAIKEWEQQAKALGADVLGELRRSEDSPGKAFLRRQGAEGA